MKTFEPAVMTIVKLADSVMASVTFLERMMTLVNYRKLIVGVVFLAVTTLLLFLSQSGLSPGLSQILIVISGMTTVATLSALSQFVQETLFRKPQASFNLSLVRQSLAVGPQAEVVHRSRVLNQTIGVDNSLALAYLRLEIEKQLRLLATELKDDDPALRDMTALSRVLVRRKILPGPWLEAIEELVSISNQAIHGIEISDNTATSVVAVGEQLIEQLCLIQAGKSISST
jgi:hypothetical protein